MRPFSKLWVLEKEATTAGSSDGAGGPHRGRHAAVSDDFVYYAHLIYDPSRNPRRKADNEDEERENRGRQ